MTAATLAPQGAEVPPPAPKGIRPALRERFAAPAYAYFDEVRNGTGFTRVTRTADGLAFGLWPSRGLYLHGIEIKTARSDWKRELADPEKAEEIARFCDFWWLATTDRVAQLEEIPENWGWLELDPKGKLKVRKEAPKLEAQPITRQFLASLFRQLYNREDAVVRGQVDRLVREERERDAEVLEELRSRVITLERDRVDAQSLRAELLGALGLEVDDHGHLTEASRQKVELFRDSKAEGLREQARHAAEQLKRVAIEARAILRAGGVRTKKPRRFW